MIQGFSNGYYLSTYWIQRTADSDEPKINEEEYQLLEEQGYDDVPIIMKVDNKNFVVEGDDSIPARTLRLDQGSLDELHFDRNPSKETILLPKPEIVKNLYF